MSVEQVSTVDFIGIDKLSRNVVLTISDDLDWIDTPHHLAILQKKLNTYLAFCESGEIYNEYPEARGRTVIFSIVAKHSINSEGIAFLGKVQTALESAGFRFQVSSAG